ncbi:serine/threonine-protein phosphatase 4 regulatory subunit-like protein isoform X1 [Wolffia australiana]
MNLCAMIGVSYIFICALIRIMINGLKCFIFSLPLIFGSLHNWSIKATHFIALRPARYRKRTVLMEIIEEASPQSSDLPLAESQQLLEKSATTHEVDNFKEAEAKFSMSDDELRRVLESIAATGKFWQEWEGLKSVLCFRLKQILAEYPESKQDSSLGERYPEIARRLEEALLSFVEGPPFTLQRLCEILLAPRSLYPKLSKLALALDKTLLVTSTITRSTEPRPMPEAEAEPESANKRSNNTSVIAAISEDADMAEAETVEDGMAANGKEDEEIPGEQDRSVSSDNHE